MFELEFEAEAETEFEDELEAERLLNPARRWYRDAMLEHFGQVAATARSAAEAEAFIGALVPLALRAAPRVAPVLMRSAPRMVQTVARIGRSLLRRPETRRLIRTLPSIVRSGVRQLTRQTARGRRPTPQQAARTIRSVASRVLRNPRLRNQVLRRSRALDRRLHGQRAARRTGVCCMCDRPF